MSIWQNLPFELVLPVLDNAARDWIYTNRSWVVNLALVSRFAHRLVHPVLYHTMVFDAQNLSRVKALMEDEAHHHIFRAVRRLVVTRQLQWEHCNYASLLSSVQYIDAPMSFVTKLAESPAFRPRRLAVRYRRLVDVVDIRSPSTLEAVTHLYGYFPDGDYQITSATLAPVLAAMPALTHIAYDNVNMTDDDPSTIPFTNLTELDEALVAALHHRRIQCVALRVAGRCIGEWADIRALLSRLQNARLHVWPDMRPITTWRGEEYFAAADALAGRDVWTEAKPIAEYRPPSELVVH